MEHKYQYDTTTLQRTRRYAVCFAMPEVNNIHENPLLHMFGLSTSDDSRLQYTGGK